MTNQTKPDSAAPGGDVEQMIKVLREIDGMRQAIGASEEIGQQYRDACCTFVHDNSEALIAALSAPKEVGAVPIDGIIDANFAEDGSTTNWLPWRVLRDDDGALWLATDDPERDIEIDQESDDE